MILLHLTPNEYSRPQKQLEHIKAIVLHWVGNAGSSARANRNFWESRADGGMGYGSAHYVVDDIEVVEAIPPDEMAYHVGAPVYSDFALQYLGDYPNNCTIGVEMCHPDWTGEPTAAVWQATARLAAGLMTRFNLQPYQLTTHHAITGKDCPRWFLSHPEELDRMRWDVAALMHR